jgi:hypothetical protein
LNGKKEVIFLYILDKIDLNENENNNNLRD